MTAISAFRTTIVPFLHSCSDLAADIAARFAIRDFCNKTDWLQTAHDPITVVAGQATYEFEPLAGTEVVRVISATFEGRDLKPASQDQLRGMIGDWRSRTGTPTFYTGIARGETILVPTPDTKSIDGFKAIISLQPSITSVAVDDSIFERWSEVIGYGARARLKEMSGQPYYDPAGAVQEWLRFGQGMADAKQERMKDFTRAVQHVQMRTF